MLTICRPWTEDARPVDGTLRVPRPLKYTPNPEPGPLATPLYGRRDPLVRGSRPIATPLQGGRGPSMEPSVFLDLSGTPQTPNTDPLRPPYTYVATLLDRRRDPLATPPCKWIAVPCDPLLRGSRPPWPADGTLGVPGPLGYTTNSSTSLYLYSKPLYTYNTTNSSTSVYLYPKPLYTYNTTISSTSLYLYPQPLYVYTSLLLIRIYFFATNPRRP